MQDLSFVGSDDNHVHLSDSAGNEYRVIIDEDLRRAARGQSLTERDATLISPREIQLEVRAGVSVEELVSKTGASIDYINKFALPVIAELAHVISTALSVRLTMAGDRYSETTQVEFGEVVASRLANIGVVLYEWSSRRTENGGWQLRCNFGDSVANWAFDPRKLVLTPENELAVQLSSHGTLTDAPLARLRPVAETQTSASPPAPIATPPVSSVTSEVPSPVAKAEVTAQADPAAVESTPAAGIDWPAAAEQSTSRVNITADLGVTAEFEGVVPFGRNAAAASEPVNDLTNTADLLDELRKKRAVRERELNEAAAIAREQDQSVEDFTPSFEDSDRLNEDTTVEAAFAEFSSSDQDEAEDLGATIETQVIETAAAEDSKGRKGRTAMPSWDEIVFGTRSEDE